MQHKHSGFTLVELAIVLVIIGFLVVAIESAQGIIKASQIRSTISEVNEFQSGVNLFLQRYEALPGDFPDATTTWPAITTVDGDNDGKIEWRSSENEGIAVWQHMAADGMIAGDFTGETATTGTPGETGPVSPLGNGGGFYFDYSAALGNFIGLGAAFATSENSADSVSAPDASEIDDKIDDGLPNTGTVRGSDGPGTSVDCQDPGSPDTYNLDESEDAPACFLQFIL